MRLTTYIGSRNVSSPASHSAGVGVPLENVCAISKRKSDVFHVRVNMKGVPKLDIKINTTIEWKWYFSWISSLCILFHFSFFVLFYFILYSLFLYILWTTTESLLKLNIKENFENRVRNHWSNLADLPFIRSFFFSFLLNLFYLSYM